MSSIASRVSGLGYRIQGAGFRVQGAGFRVQGAGFRVYQLLERAELAHLDRERLDVVRLEGQVLDAPQVAHLV